MAENIAKTARRQLGGAISAIWRIIAELDKPKRTLSKINLRSIQVSCLSYVFKLGIILIE